MRSIANFALPEGTTWLEHGHVTSTQKTVRRLTNGGVYVFMQRLKSGFNLNIEFNEKYVWLTHNQVQQLVKLYNMPTAHTVNWDSFTAKAVILGLNFKPLIEYEELEKQLYTGNIKLTTV